MRGLLNFEFVAVLNLLVLVLWPATGTYTGVRRDVVSIIMIILTIIAVVLDIFFLVLSLAH